MVDSSDEEGDKSIVFVSETKPVETTPRTERDQLRQENKDMKHRIRKLEIHIGALQKHVHEQPSVPIENIAIENGSVQHPPEYFGVNNDQSLVLIENPAVENLPIENEPVDLLPVIQFEEDIGFSMDDEWLLNQLNDINQNGNLSSLAEQMSKDLENTE